MKYTPARGSYLEKWEVADSTGVLGIANEGGDITAYVQRPDGTYGHCYGGPVYNPEPEFLNVCERTHDWPWWDEFVCDHKSDMTPAERATADVFARKVGWMESAQRDGSQEGRTDGH